MNAGSSICPPGFFNKLAVSKEDCYPCYCSELTDTCSSADLYLSALPPPTGVYQLVSRDPSTARTTVLQRLKPELKSSTVQRLYVATRAGLGDTGVPYFSLPQSHTGNQLKSYGGYLKFTLSFEGEGSPINEPMIVVQVTNISLRYKEIKTKRLISNWRYSVEQVYWG